MILPHKWPITFALLITASIATLSCDKLKSSATSPKENGLPAAGTATFSPNQIQELNSANFNSFIARKDGLLIVDFNATWCGPCKRLGPVLEKAAALHSGIVFIGKVDVDQSPEVGSANKVSSIPDVRIYKGGVLVDQFVGFPGESQVLEKIAQLTQGMSAVPVTAAPKPKAQEWKDGLPPGFTRRTK
jgi:thioredoxin 1